MKVNNSTKNMSLLYLTWPIFIELVLQMLVSNVDQLMISRFSENAVAAIGNVNTIMNVLLITFSVITMATTILVSQYLGAENYKKVSEVYSVAVFSNIAFSIIISITLLMSGKAIFSIMQLPTELMSDAMIYMNIIGGGLIFQAIFMTYSAIFRSNGKMKEGMYVSVIVNLLNILGNAILLNGWLGIPKLQIEGVAISSVISRAIGVIIIIWLFKRQIKGKIKLSYLKPFPIETFKGLMKIGLPAGGETVSYNMSQMVIMTFINMMGTTVITAKSYVGILTWFSYLYGSAVSQGNQIRVGYAIGAKDKDLAEKNIRDTLKPAAFIGVLVSVTICIFSDQLLGIFTSNQEILELGKRILIIDVVLEIGRTFNMVIIRGIQAAGDIKYPIFIGILFMWIIATLFSYIFGVIFGWGLEGVWIAMMIDECLRGFIFYRRLGSGKWRNKSIM